MMLAKQYIPPHPIVFVMDFLNHDVEVPEYNPKTVVSNNDTCVSVRTIADADGEATVVLADHLPPDTAGAARRVFVGKIRTPSGMVALVTSENQKLVECKVKKDTVDLEIFVDDEVHPTTVWVILAQTSIL